MTRQELNQIVIDSIYSNDLNWFCDSFECNTCPINNNTKSYCDVNDDEIYINEMIVGTLNYKI